MMMVLGGSLMVCSVVAKVFYFGVASKVMCALGVGCFALYAGGRA